MCNILYKGILKKCNRYMIGRLRHFANVDLSNFLDISFHSTLHYKIINNRGKHIYNHSNLRKILRISWKYDKIELACMEYII